MRLRSLSGHDSRRRVPLQNMETQTHRHTEAWRHRDAQTQRHRDTDTETHRETETQIHRHKTQRHRRTTENHGDTGTQRHKDPTQSPWTGHLLTPHPPTPPHSPTHSATHPQTDTFHPPPQSPHARPSIIKSHMNNTGHIS